MGERDDGAGSLLLKHDFFEGCPGCMFDQQKQMQRGLPIKQVLTIWIIVLSTGDLMVFFILNVIEAIGVLTTFKPFLAERRHE